MDPNTGTLWARERPYLASGLFAIPSLWQHKLWSWAIKDLTL